MYLTVLCVATRSNARKTLEVMVKLFILLIK